jgi:membrane protein DedA with SNARE-associated domain
VFSFHHLLLQHGYAFLFVYVLLVGFGLPIPADPLLLVMGAIIGDHYYAFPHSLLAAASAALIGDYFWFELGRRRGRSVLSLLCKLSIEPDTCVRKTETTFNKRGIGALFFAKFIPGMSLVSMPLAGMIGMPRLRFLLADGTGCLLWSTAYLSLGILFHRQVDLVITLLGLFGRRAGVVIAGLIGLYLAFKYFQRWRILRELRINRVTPQTVRQLLEEGCELTIVDLRHPAEVARDAFKLPGAVVLRPDELSSLAQSLSPEREIILYCT